jgi:hypothetical protein
MTRGLQEHKASKTSFLMSLLDHVFRALELKFVWENFITSYCTSYDEARLGEIFINGLAQNYHNTSYGVAVHPAGDNCTSARFTDKQHSAVEACLEKCVLFRFNKTPYEANMQAEEDNFKRRFELKAHITKTRKKTLNRLKRQLEQDTPDTDDLLALQRTAVLDPTAQVPEHIRAAFAAAHADVDRALQEWAPLAGQGDPPSES